MLDLYKVQKRRWGQVMDHSRDAVPRVDFLGTGNAFSPHGRMHALALIDGSILIDTPPTLLTQLRRSGFSGDDIEHILFTHWHGDHNFGFPFLMLDRKYISNRDAKVGLDVYLRPGGRNTLASLCRLGFPGSLEALDQMIDWHESEHEVIGDTGWKFYRFPVLHNPETDPHGYELVHESNFRLLHCGDSGPCDEINNRAGRADVIIVEMGMPDIGEFPHHHRPSDVVELASRNPHAKILVTHNYSSGKGFEEGFEIPNLPDTICQLEDGDSLIIDEEGSFDIIRKN